VSEDWRQSTWGAEISLEYGKAIRGYQHAVAPYRVFGSNGPIGWTESALAAGPGVILGRKGAYRGVQFSTEPFFVIDTAYFVKPKTELDMRWLYYAIIHHKLGEIDDGSPIPSTTRAAVYVRDVDVPSLPEQRAIAATLGALDDKIDLNRRMNETLEAMARALFRDWFFDFGPTRAKMAGTTPYLSPDLWSLFPDRLDDEGKPEGWEMRPVGDFAELKGGKQLEKKHISDTGPVPVFGGAGVMGFTTNHNADGFVISVGRVGAYCGQFFSHRGRSWINNNASLIRPNLKVSGEWLLISLRHIDMDVIKKGAAQPFVSNGDIAKVGIIWPSHAIVSAFSETLVSLMKKAEANEQESRTLAQTRDLLLPRLMSGELRVSEATFEREVEA
jgi:type I restriction enzyme S subunit